MFVLGNQFAGLAESGPAGDTAGLYHGISIRSGGCHLLVKLPSGGPCILMGTSNGVDSFPAPIKLENITVQHGISGQVHGMDLHNGSKFYLICLTTTEPSLVSVFLRFAEFLCAQLEDKPTAQNVAARVRQLVDMLQILRQP